jgi:hypothetical protein
MSFPLDTSGDASNAFLSQKIAHRLVIGPPYFCFSASRWKNASSGRHVDYDQKPDFFR